MLIKTNKIVREAIDSFQGELLSEIPSNSVKYKSETFIGEMTHEEKVLWTIYSNIKAGTDKIISKICGKNTDEMSSSEQVFCSNKIENEATEKDKKYLSDAVKNGKLFYEAVFESISKRLIKNKKYNVIVIRKGWKVFAGNSNKIVGKVQTDLDGNSTIVFG